jgi:hypothetical protein
MKQASLSSHPASPLKLRWNTFVLLRGSLKITHVDFRLRAVYLLLCFLSISIPVRVHAQYNGEYDFEAHSVTDGVDGDGHLNTTSMPILTMDCLAANGYGQWTMTTQTGVGGYGAGWYLLENTLQAPTTATGPTTPPGVAAHGSFSAASRFSPMQPKVTANLDGSVNYVFPSANRKSFDVEYFGPSDIDISLNGIPNNGSSAFPAGLQIIKASGLVTHSASVTTSDGVNYHDIIGETDFRDDFDVCSDAHFLYIVWASITNTGTGNPKTIYLTVVNLSTYTTSTPIVIGQGKYPTIACDVRYNRSGGTSVWYEIAYIAPGGTTAIWYYNHAGTTGTYTINPVYELPSTGVPTSCGTIDHVRALVSSVAGGSQYSALYEIVANTAGKHLIMYNPNNSNTPNPLLTGDAAYVDGPLMSSPNIKDAPIIAFANPYDNQISPYTYDQFHCLYQWDQASLPLYIVRNSDNGEAYPTNPGSPTDYRLALSGASNPGYVGAANQMGLHVHWRTGVVPGGTHFYCRDRNRKIDEPIDENTLLTGEVNLDDGRGHGGTFGSTITKNYRMTIWEDPIFGFSSTDWTLGDYQPDYPGGRLVWADDNVTDDANMRLTVGDGNSSSAATLTIGTDAFLDLDVDTYIAGQGVTVNANSTLDYYGLYKKVHNSGTLVFYPLLPFGGGIVYQEGGGDLYLNGTASLPANLIIHGGADLHMGELSTFESNYGNIDIKYEPSIFPINSSGAANANASGIMELECNTTFTHSTITGHFTSSSSNNYMIRVLNSFSDHDGDENTSTTQLTSSNTTYTNSGGGTAVIRFDNSNPYLDPIFAPSTPYLSCSFSDDNFNSVDISAVDPQNDFTISSSTFNGGHEIAVDLRRENFTTYGNMLVTGNTFNDPGNHSAYDIHGYQFNTQAMSQLDVESNTLYRTYAYNGDNPVTGIFYEQSTGLIGYNDLYGGFYAGIKDYGKDASNLDQTLICSNLVTNGVYNPNLGSLTKYYDGYLKLNEFSFCSYGFENDAGGPAHLVCNKSHDNTYNGIILYNSGSGTSVVDLSGVHHNGESPGTGDLAGLNEVWNNSGPQIDLASTTVNLWLTQDNIGSTWTATGQNNIYKGTGSSNVLIQGDANGNASVDIGSNYWGAGLDPQTPWTASTYVPSFNYSASTTASSQSTISGIDCSGGLITFGKGGEMPEAIEDDTVSLKFCNLIVGDAIGWNSSQDHTLHDLSCDTMLWYFMHCYPFATADAFGGAFQVPLDSINNPQAVLDIRSVLIGALRLRSDDSWFCWIVGAIAGTYWNYPMETSDNRSELSVLKFLIDNPRCAAYRDGLGKDYADMRSSDYQNWQDTANGYPWIHETYDSSLLSMHDLGLDSVLFYASVNHYETLGSQIIGDAHVTINPFEDQTSLSLTIEREAYIHIEIFDLLGRKLKDVDNSGVFEPGSREIPLGISSLPSGSYYLRISTANNETRTLKLIKQ